MKLLQIIKGMDIGGHNGGSEKFGLELSLGLRKAGIDTSLCAFYHHATPTEQAWMERLEKAGIDVIFASNASHGNPLPGFRSLAEKCQAQNINLAHSHFQVGSLAAVYLKLSRITPFIIRTAHITKEWGDGPLAWVSQFFFTDWVFPLIFDAEAGVSQAIVDQLNHRPAATLFGKKGHRVYNALSDQMISDAPHHQEGTLARFSHPDQFIIGSIGRFTNRKGYPYLIQAFAAFHKKNPDSQLWLVGDGEDRTKLENMALQLGIADGTRFLGQRADVPDLLGQMDLFILPSIQEGLPTVILESMACGVPVVATDIPGTRELVHRGETGWLVPPGNTPELANAILAAYHHPELRKLYRSNAAKIVTGFRFSNTVDLYLKIYRDLLK